MMQPFSTRRIALAAAVASAVALLSLAGLAEEQGAGSGRLRLRLVPIQEGHVEAAFGRDAERFRATAAYRAGAAAGVDIAAPAHPLLIHAYENGRLYYLFYNRVDQAWGPAAYLIQRVKKTVKNYAAADGEPRTTTTYLVEVLKTRAGSTPADQHFGSFSRHNLHRREIVKEFEIGFGEIEGVATGRDWPFEADRRFEQIHDYREDGAVYARVEYTASVTWTLRLVLEGEGQYRIRAPEMGIDAPAVLPELSAVAVEVDPQSRQLVLDEGRGVGELTIGESRAADIERALGPPLEVARASAAANNYTHRHGLTFNVLNDGPINTIITGPTFGGKTSKGVAHGDSRQRVVELYGETAAPGRGYLVYEGVLFYFDAADRVDRIVLGRIRGGAQRLHPDPSPAEAKP